MEANDEWLLQILRNIRNESKLSSEILENVIPLLTDGLEQLGRELVKNPKLNPVRWLAQYLLRKREITNHEKIDLSILESIPKSRIFLLRKRIDVKDSYEKCKDSMGIIECDKIFQNLDEKWNANSRLYKNLKNNFLVANNKTWVEFWNDFTDFVEKNSLILSNNLNEESKNDINIEEDDIYIDEKNIDSDEKIKSGSVDISVSDERIKSGSVDISVM
eukprot:GHVL01018943.1.p2 GENE.GHVL01018943.1~~GHVL01018943.1.p2  ORF type:complete len:218 (+),score=66.63 GHVL01018943.1:531-1184(+)